MKQHERLLIGIILATSLLISACSNNSSKAKGESEEQVLNVTISEEIPSLDTAKSMNGTSAHVMQNIFEGLYVLDEKDNPVPGVAKSFEKSTDGKTYIFHLRKDAKWSNGDAVTAHDFVYSWQRTVKPETASQSAYMLFYIKNAETINKGALSVDQLGVKAIDDVTLEVQLEKPIPYFIHLLPLPIYLPQHKSFVEGKGSKYGLEPEHMIYNGPFVLSEWKHEQEFKLKRNDTYWDKNNVKLKEINFHIVKDTATAVNLYETNSIDRTPINSSFVDKYKGKSDFHTTKDSAMAMLRFNQKNSVLANIKIRQSLSMALNKEAVVNHFLNNGAAAAQGIVPVGYKNEKDGKDFRKENGDLAVYNVEKAKNLWEDAKKELGVEHITLEFLTFEQDQAKQTAEYMKEELEKNLQGLTIKIKQQPFKQKLQLEQTGQYDMSMVVWGPDYKDPISYLELFTTDNPNNRMSYSNQHYDELINNAKNDFVLEDKKRWKAMQEAEKILLEDAAIAPLYHTGSAYVQKEYVKGIEKHQFGGVYTYKHAYINQKEK
ncbi:MULTISPECIES: peptide ABC transporter substrate-binding protein [unclassified Bacillus (in: firmicutes)]|uniref:peptide ABC transporter substrate-binding protein n=1 Tax=unclassified Bacillus (in: firmicutes) TaxID=185979 RepID=UPI0008EB289D|nr:MULTISPECIES: peptide ABC transporter substrate-binding protein [unclassified Bacillus (in: firmicutes)]SFI07141.1 oligopeptide transport system substrate-binding protein [Bacillus sp. 71mf]SFS78379.1 oligopeptide transport system substrate-binding protein [Bacillus sp. 103mf]